MASDSTSFSIRNILNRGLDVQENTQQSEKYSEKLGKDDFFGRTGRINSPGSAKSHDTFESESRNGSTMYEHSRTSCELDLDITSDRQSCGEESTGEDSSHTENRQSKSKMNVFV